jgi:hypothetical protein
MPDRVFPKSEEHPHIDTIMKDGSFYHLPSRVLEVLLNNDRVSKFRRSSGWVTVGVDPVRSKPRRDACPVYYGPERRNSKETQLSSIN